MLKLLTFVFSMTIAGASAGGMSIQNSALEQLQHSNSMMLIKPFGYSYEILDEGFMLKQSGNLRYNSTITVKKIDKSADMDTAISRILPNGKAKYAVKELGAGSGGMEYKLEAILEHNDEAIYINSFEQHELRKPDFRTAWDVIKTIRLK